MNVVIADVESPVLDAAAKELEAFGTKVLAVQCDVSDYDAMQKLATKALAEFDQINVICLNAGVAGGNGPIETLSEKDWAWTLGVNVFGITNGISAFLGHMKEHGDGHVVITASIAGLTSFPGAAPYNTSKHAAIAIAETMFSELRDAGSSIGVSCLCPGIVNTNIMSSERNRPEKFTAGGVPDAPTEAQLQSHKVIVDIFNQAKKPEAVADLVHDAVLAKQFWIFTDEIYTPSIHERLDAIRDRQDPPARGSLVEVYLK